MGINSVYLTPHIDLRVGEDIGACHYKLEPQALVLPMFVNQRVAFFGERSHKRVVFAFSLGAIIID